MKIRKVINHSGIGELSLPMVLAANFCSVEVWKSCTVSFQYSFLLKCKLWSYYCITSLNCCTANSHEEQS